MEYLSSLNNDDFLKISLEIYDTIKFVSNHYPNFKEWYEKVLKEIPEGTRDIIFIRNERELKGFIIIKNSINEKKICSLYIKENFRKIGLATKLIEESFKVLKTTTPIISIPKETIKEFLYFIKKYN
jgi:ribosomal protein S18 acetylase RimI-like enzyme